MNKDTIKAIFYILLCMFFFSFAKSDEGAQVIVGLSVFVFITFGGYLFIMWLLEKLRSK